MLFTISISDSLENYIQEAGRAGRDEKLKAKCYILFSVKDLDKHFELLNFSKVSRKEIGQVWTGIKRELKTNEYFSKKYIGTCQVIWMGCL